jgi:hypothetical protein
MYSSLGRHIANLIGTLSVGNKCRNYTKGTIRGRCLHLQNVVLCWWASVWLHTGQTEEVICCGTELGSYGLDEGRLLRVRE